jgi:hypothetical protein
MIPNYKSNVNTAPPSGTETDILHKLRPAISSAVTIPKVEYDDNLLDNIGKTAGEIMNEVRTAAEEQAAQKNQMLYAQQSAESDKQARAGINTRDTGSDNLLAMIFKIVPIGINIFKKGKTVATGLKRTALGLVNLVKNLAITTAILGVDSIVFAFQSAYYSFKVMLCAIGGLSNLHKCILFFIVDLILYLFLLMVTSVLFMIDVFFQVKRLAGISCVEMLILALDGVEEFDKLVYSFVGIHPFHYPDMIIEMCYTCSAMGDTSGFKKASKKMYGDVFVMVPNKIGSPLGDIVRGIGNIFDLFNV